MGWLDRLGIGGKPSSQRQAESLNKKAIDSLRQGKIDEAEKWLLEATRLAPDMAAAHHNLGAVYLTQKRHSQALKHMRLALQLDPGDVETRIAVAKIYGDMGKADRSMAEYERICADAPEDWRSRISLGNALLDRGRFEEAIEQLKKAVQLKPKEELTHLVLATAYERGGRLEMAIKEYRAVRNMTRIGQNRSAASEKMKELQLRQRQGSSSPAIEGGSALG